MVNDDDWIATRITNAGKRHPLVTEAVAARVDELLRGRLGEQLTSTELTTVAKALVAEMVPALPKAESKE